MRNGGKEQHRTAEGLDQRTQKQGPDEARTKTPEEAAEEHRPPDREKKGRRGVAGGSVES